MWESAICAGQSRRSFRHRTDFSRIERDMWEASSRMGVVLASPAEQENQLNTSAEVWDAVLALDVGDLDAAFDDAMAVEQPEPVVPQPVVLAHPPPLAVQPQAVQPQAVQPVQLLQQPVQSVPLVASTPVQQHAQFPQAPIVLAQPIGSATVLALAQSSSGPQCVAATPAQAQPLPTQPVMSAAAVPTSLPQAIAVPLGNMQPAPAPQLPSPSSTHSSPVSSLQRMFLPSLAEVPVAGPTTSAGSSIPSSPSSSTKAPSPRRWTAQQRGASAGPYFHPSANPSFSAPPSYGKVLDPKVTEQSLAHAKQSFK